MLKITEIVKDGILEICFSDQDHHIKLYTIMNQNGDEIIKGKIAGFTQRSCLYIGELKKGNYKFKIDEHSEKTFLVI